LVPPNVKQQIELWEKDLNCIKARQGMLIIINSQEMAQRFVQYAMKENINLYKKNVVNPDTPSKIQFVIDIKNIKEAMDFL